MESWSFPIIATVWWFIAATSFVGEEAHAANLSPGRRTLLNVVIWVAGTWLILRTIVWIPPFWFGFVQTLLVTGGFAYLLRGIKQPIKSVYAWAILALDRYCHCHIDLVGGLGSGSRGRSVENQDLLHGGVSSSGSGAYKFRGSCPYQSWPFSPSASPGAPHCHIRRHRLVSCSRSGKRVMALQTLRRPCSKLKCLPGTRCLGFCFALLYGIGSQPYLWAGQKTPGTWEDLDK
jgi:hypothetical protein